MASSARRVLMRLREYWLGWRNRRLADPAFQRRAMRSRLMRRVARRYTTNLFDLCAGFVYSQVLFACVQLDVFKRLGEQPLTPRALGAQLDLTPESTESLLAAAASLDLLERLKDGRYALASLGASLLGNPGVAAMIAHHDRLYLDLADPVALLRQGTGSALADYWGYAVATDPEHLDVDRTADYTQLMSRSQTMIAEQVLDVCDLSACRLLLDVGGGDGSFAVTAVRAYPDLQAVVFDLPGVTPHTRKRIDNADLAKRIRVTPGNFLREEWPPGADLITLIRVIHDHDDDAVLALLRAAHKALAPGGRLLIAEPMAEPSGNARMANAYFGFYLRAMGQGRIRSARCIADMIDTAGFDLPRIRRTPIPLLAGVIEASKKNN